MPDQPQPQGKKKRTLKRTLASCTGCRRRRTRCDRLDPCSECLRRNVECSYEGATAPPISAQRGRDQNHLDEREQYIKQLEARLEALEQSKTSPPERSEPVADQPPDIDFSTEDLAFSLGQITLGTRVRYNKHRHPLESQLEAMIATSPNRSNPPVFLTEQRFNMSLIPTGPLTPLDQIQASLPSREDLEELSRYFFDSLNIWVPSINRSSWGDTVSRCYGPLPPRPTLESIHRLAAVLAVAGHGLLRKADEHGLDSSSKTPVTNLREAQIKLAHRWFHLALGALTQHGEVLSRPTVWGIRAMSLLGVVQLAPQDFDHAIFFWSIVPNLASTAGLLQEPPGFDAQGRAAGKDAIDELELESRRQLAWYILGMHWTTGAISGGIQRPFDPQFDTVKMPGTVACELDEVDGWPIDPIVALRKASALCDCLAARIISLMSTNRLVSYNEISGLDRDMSEFEEMIPKRLRLAISADGRSIEALEKSDTFRTMVSCGVWMRICTSRVRLHRVFLFAKQIPESEQLHHMKALEVACRRHFLMSSYFPYSYMMHPMVIYAYVNTAIASALALMILPNVFDPSFFMLELRKLMKIFVQAQQTIASSLARNAVMLLETLLGRAETSGNLKEVAACGPSAHKRLSPAQVGSHFEARSVESDELKHKSFASTTYEDGPTSFDANHMSNHRLIITPRKTPHPPPLPPDNLGRFVNGTTTRHNNIAPTCSSSLPHSSLQVVEGSYHQPPGPTTQTAAQLSQHPNVGHRFMPASQALGVVPHRVSFCPTPSSQSTLNINPAGSHCHSNCIPPNPIGDLSEVANVRFDFRHPLPLQYTSTSERIPNGMSASSLTTEIGSHSDDYLSWLKDSVAGSETAIDSNFLNIFGLLAQAQLPDPLQP